MEIIRKWLALLPAGDFERFNHLLDVEVVLKLAELLKDLANAGEKCREFKFECLMSEMWYLSSASNHFLKMVEVLVGFDKLVQRQHGGHMDAVHLWVSTFDMFDVQLVPFFARLKEILLPLSIGIKCTFHRQSVIFEHTIDVDQCCLTVPHINHCTVGNIIYLAVDVQTFALLEEHRSDIHLLIGLGFSARNLKILDHLKQCVQERLIVVIDVRNSHFECFDIRAYSHELGYCCKFRSLFPGFKLSLLLLVS